MKKHLYIKWLLPALMIALYACKKIINVNLNDAAPQIVIEGVITNAPGPYQVQISKTVNFSDANVFPAVSGAVVKISDNNTSITDVLTETSPGIYTTHVISGVPGHAYKLSVVTGGQTYTASSVMPQPVPLDSISFQKTSSFNKTTINVSPNYQDPAGINNYYTFTQYVNSKKLPTVLAFDDRLTDGKYVTRILRLDSSYINLGDTVQVKMNCVDQNTFNYFYTLVQVSGNSTFQSVTPSNPVSNISNNALGYFSANTTQTKKAIAR
jgi:hypothetical protein